MTHYESDPVKWQQAKVDKPAEYDPRAAAKALGDKRSELESWREDSASLAPDSVREAVDDELAVTEVDIQSLFERVYGVYLNDIELMLDELAGWLPSED